MMKEEIEQQCEKSLQELISSGLMEVSSVDEDGNFCYGLTEDGYKVANGEDKLSDYDNNENS